MSIANVLIYVVLIVYILYGKARGWPMKAPKRLFLLPVLLVIIGYGDAAHGKIKAAEVVLTVIGAVLSLGLGLLRGRADKVSYRNGAQYVQWGGLSFALFATNIVAKLILDGIGIAAGSTFAEVDKSLILTLGLTLLGEAIVLLVRSGATSGLSNSDRSGSAPTGQAPSGRFADMAAFSASQSSASASAEQGNGGQRRPNLRDRAANWQRQQGGQTVTTDSYDDTSSYGSGDDVRRERHEHHDHDHHDHDHHDHHHNHHGLTGPS